jgi:methylated-DNA-[protein]-cysteine S-methyltransferase
MGTRSKKFKSIALVGIATETRQIRCKMVCRGSMIHLPGPERRGEMASIKSGRLRVASRGPIKNLWLIWNPTGLLAVAWTEADLKQVAGRLEGEAAPPEKATIPERFATVLRRYFAGEPVDPARLPVDMRGTAFQLAVWRALRRIPRGSVSTYGELAAQAGFARAARAAGSAAGANPLPVVVPCHRLLAAGPRLGGYSGGLRRKRMLLELEGVRVSDFPSAAAGRPA